MAYLTIDTIQVASPCDAQWSDMQGDDLARLCAQCNNHVYNLSLLTRAEANELIREKENDLCVKLYRRFDGTVLTADCPRGLRAVRKHFLLARAKAIAAVVTLLAYLGVSVASCSVSTTVGLPARDTP